MKYLSMPWSRALSSHPLSCRTELAKGSRWGVLTRLPSQSYIEVLGSVQAYMRWNFSRHVYRTGCRCLGLNIFERSTGVVHGGEMVLMALADCFRQQQQQGREREREREVLRDWFGLEQTRDLGHEESFFAPTVCNKHNDKIWYRIDGCFDVISASNYKAQSKPKKKISICSPIFLTK